MPTISIDKSRLCKSLGREYTDKEFDELCFEFGIELDDTVTEENGDVTWKIEIPANRYDCLCEEGLQLNLNVFLGRQSMPNFRVVSPPNGECEVMKVDKSVESVRPYVSAAILRNISFTKERYESFIALQDKLHQNLCRQRKLVSMGTHNLDTIKGPFTYTALPPKDIKFVPLNKTELMDGERLMEVYDADKNLGKYLPIIRDSPLYPVVLDVEGNVCSLPPIINSERSKITLDTKNVFIEVTATDKTKVEIVTNMLVAMFSMYCAEPFTVEPVKIESEHNGESRVVPNLTPRTTEAEVKYINQCCGLKLSREEICTLLTKMAYIAKPNPELPDIIDVDIPVTRADVLHQCDIMEDVAIAYGYNNLPKTFPNKSSTVAEALPINKLSDLVRLETAMAGWSEVMPLILCSHDENFAWLNHTDDGNTAVKLANPKTLEYQVVRTTLVPGLLKTIRENRKHSLPIRVFEASDVVFKDDAEERKARNERHFGAAWCGKTSGFEVVHGLLDRLMLMLAVGINQTGAIEKKEGYWIEETSDPMFFPGRAAKIMVQYPSGKVIEVGNFGVVHPSVLEKFEITYPVSTLTLNLEAFL
ncbi:phenylalanyl-tRNA synthetase [Ascobolus immersus RN42]|uniref:phenylalanine--tRNA ligase n=1 Tax=Ascobolus immersus RN42 TaxID=1160509 RepID=A0A3N4IM66_ASCIM|nr:phenylalanyl-tRNA synthetase [Ascobolus immersus RN42]